LVPRTDCEPFQPIIILGAYKCVRLALNHGKHSIYKNAVRGWIHLQALVDGKVLTPIPVAGLSLWYLIYQQMQADFSSKWLYCAGLYNKAMEGGQKSVSSGRVALGST
jgi:hypothetical protein